MRPCSRCGQSCPEGTRFCTRCGAALDGDTLPAAAREEVGHIAYLMAQADRWRADGWITPALLWRLRQTYGARESVLLSGAAPASAVPLYVPAPAPPARPAPAAAPPIAAAKPMTPAPPSEASAPQAAPPRLEEFLVEHWLKLAAVLGAALTFGAIRQFVGMEWMWKWITLLLPLLPGGLAALLYHYGMRERETKSIGAFACTSVAVVLAGFTVVAIDRSWLGGVLGDRPGALLAALCSTALAWRTMRATGDERHLHLILAGATASALALMQVAAPSPVFAPRPGWLHGLAMVALAGLFLGSSGLAAREHDDAPAVLALWAHLCVGLGVSIASVPALVLREPEAVLATPTLAAGLMYAAAAEARRCPGFAQAGAACTACAALVALWGAGLVGAALYPVGLAAAGLGVLWWLASAAPRTVGSTDDAASGLRQAYERAAIAATIAACCVAAVRGLGLTGVPLVGADWPEVTTLFALCSMLVAVAALRRGQPLAMYGSAACTALALGIGTDRLFVVSQHWASVPISLDLAAFALLGLALGVGLREDRDEGPDSGAPWLRASALAVGAGILFAQLSAASGTAYWFALLPHALAAALGAVVALRAVGRWDAMAWAAAAVVGLSLLAQDSPWASTSRALAQWRDYGAVLAAMGLVWAGALHALGARRREHPWCIPLEAGVACCAAAAMASTVMFGPPAWVAGVAAACCAALALVPGASTSIWPLALAYAAVFGGWLQLAGEADLPWRAEAAVWPAVLPLFGCAALASAARKERADVALWLSAGCLPLLVLSGVASVSAAHAVAWVAAAGLLVAAIGFGYAAWALGEAAYSPVAALAFLAAYALAYALLPGASAEWSALSMLPAFAALEVAARRLPAREGSDLYREPFRSVALVGIWLAVVGAALASWTAPLPLLGVCVASLAYGVLIAVLAATETPPSELLGKVAAALVVVGMAHALFIGGGTRASLIASLAVAAAAPACWWAYMRLARSTPAFASAATVFACAGWFALVAGGCRAHVDWWALAMLPCFAGLYSVSVSSLPVGEDAARCKARDTLLALASLGAAGALVCGLDPGVIRPAVIATLAAYGLALVAAAIQSDRPVCTVLAASVLTVAWGYGLAVRPGMSAPGWACGMAVAGAVWLVAGRVVVRAGHPIGHVNVLQGMAAVVALGAAAVGLIAVQTPGQGVYTVLALAVAGAVYLGLYLFEQAPIHAHTGFGLFFAAYGLMLYDHVSIAPSVMDLYLAPLGLYLVVLGEMAGARREDGQANGHWWLGLLTTMTPTFLSFCETRGTAAASGHAVLLIAECLGALAWGIPRRIRAFAFCAAAHAFAFAAVLAGGRVADAGSATASLVAGIALLAFVYRVGTRQDLAREWMARVTDEWSKWR